MLHFHRTRSVLFWRERRRRSITAVEPWTAPRCWALAPPGATDCALQLHKVTCRGENGDNVPLSLHKDSVVTGDESSGRLENRFNMWLKIKMSPPQVLNMPLCISSAFRVMFSGPYWLSFKSLHDCCRRQERLILLTLLLLDRPGRCCPASALWVHAPTE